MATTAAPAVLEKDEQIIHPTSTKTKSDPPLDFSFLNITSPKGKFESDCSNILLINVLAAYNLLSLECPCSIFLIVLL